MLLPAITALLGLIGAAAAATTSMRTCAADNCLRAVQASGFPTRHGTADCSSYLLVTVTPATTTVIKTTTRFSSSTNTAHVTSTSTSDVTATSVISVAATSLLDVTATSIVDVTATTTVEVEGGSHPGIKRGNVNVEDKAVARRQATVKPSSIPAYASPCSGAARYSSACSCLGVTARTTTVAGPSTTKTVTSTRTTVVQTVTKTDSTAITTVTDATSIITTTTGTITSTITALTTTTTVTDSTTTATTTIIPTGPDCSSGQSISSFILQVSGSVLNNQYASLTEEGFDTVSVTSDIHAATIFSFNDACNVLGNGETGIVAPDSAASNFFFDVDPTGFIIAICTIQVDATFTCIAGANTIFIECESSSPIHLASYVPNGCQELSLIAISVN